MSNPLLLIRIASSPTGNCLNIVFAEAEYDRKLFLQLIRCSVCGDTRSRLIWDKFSQMFRIFRFHPQSEQMVFFTPVSCAREVGMVIPTCLFLYHVENNHPLGHRVTQQGGNQRTDVETLRPTVPLQWVNCDRDNCRAARVASGREEQHAVAVGEK